MKIWTDVNRDRCPECHSIHIQKNGKKKGKGDRICIDCGRQFADDCERRRDCCDGIEREGMRMHINGRQGILGW